MSLYLEQIRQLVDLQRVDDALFLVQTDLKHAPREVDDLRQRFESQNASKERALDKMQHLQEQSRRLDVELDDDSSRIKKSKSKLMQVGNNREYQAMLREVDSMERQNLSREDERSMLLEALQQQQELLAEAEQQWASLKEQLDTKMATLEERVRVANTELTRLERIRATTGDTVPAPVLARYEFIRRRLEHPVIVPVADGVCTGCHITIPPQVYIELQRGKQIHSCPNCQRLVYWTEHFQDSEQKQAKQEEASPE